MKFTRLFTLLAMTGLAGSAYATNGYFSHGYGMSAKGMGGAGIAFPQDTLAAATNPAGMVHLGNRMDIGLEVFVPDRGFTYGAGSPDGNGSGVMESWFPIPEFGYNTMLSNSTSVGVAVFGNGGLNTTFADGDHPFTQFPGGTPGSDVSINLIQLFVSPTVSHKVNDQLSVGASLNLIAQSFQSKGLGAFGQADNGKDYSYGLGARFGTLYKLNDMVSLGATYQTKGYMSKFDDYAALFPNRGEFDIPASYGVGIALKATPTLDIAFDIMRIEYEGVDVTGNKALFSSFQQNRHGFGWEDQTVFKLGAAYKYSKDLTLRAGFNYGDQPIDVAGSNANPDDITSDLNTLAPGVVEKHLTFGFTKNLTADTSVTGYYMHAFNEEVDGFGRFLGPTKLEMNQNAVGVSYNKKF